MQSTSSLEHDPGPLWSHGAAGPFLAITFASSWACYWVAAFGPVPEEIGWRGYALGGLLGPRPGRRRVLVASLVIGVVWTLWHVPLYFIEGTYQAEEVGFLTRRFWLFAGGTFFEPVLYTAIFLATGGSTLAAILFHFAGNATGELLDLSARAEGISFALSLVAVAIVLWVLMRNPAGSRVQPPGERDDQS